MAAPRSTSLRALRSLSQQHPTSSFTPAQVRRNLHITGSQSARPANGPDRQSLYLSRSLADLKTECQKRSLRTGGNKSELVDRLSNHDVLQTRAFSIAMRKIDRQAFGGGKQQQSQQQSQPQQTQSQQATRHFNTSRANKTVKDSSTIDFAYMPMDYSNVDLPAYMTNDFFPSTLDGAEMQRQPRIPTPPDAYTHGMSASSSFSPTSTSAQDAPMKPEIHYVGDIGSDSNGPSAMSEVVDNDSADINPFDLTEQVGRARRNAQSFVASSSASLASSSKAKAAAATASEAGGEVRDTVKELWGGFMDDVFGESKRRV
ncbi:hypothetical protein FQN54_009611 [Arachnomyces sp. PD_36]|nr:hypothetical protein FQN54_009611 [Arachnomyces sp. PD_36]